MGDLLERALAQMSRLLMLATALCLAAMMLHVCADIILKSLFNSPIPGTAEVVAHYYMVAAVFLPLPFVEIRNAGISVDLFYNLLGPCLRRSLLLLAYLGQVVYFCLFAIQSSADAWSAIQIRDYVSAQIIVTVWPAALFLPIGFWVAAAVSLLRAIQVLLRPDWEEHCRDKRQDDPGHPVKDPV